MSEKLTKDSVPEDFTLALALVDAIPVIFFGANGIVLYRFFPYALLLAGAILSLISGLVKVLWKVIVVVKRRNVWPMFWQMRIFLPLGFALMVAAVVLHAGQIAWREFLTDLLSLPTVIFMGLGILGIVLMIVWAIVLDNGDKKANWVEQLTNGLSQLAFFIGLCFML